MEVLRYDTVSQYAPGSRYCEISELLLNCFFFSKTFVLSLIPCSTCAASSAEKVNLKSFWVSFSKQLLNECTQKAVRLLPFSFS